MDSGCECYLWFTIGIAILYLNLETAWPAVIVILKSDTISAMFDARVMNFTVTGR